MDTGGTGRSERMNIAYRTSFRATVRWATLKLPNIWRIMRHGRGEGLNRGVVMERHYALNWLIGYAGRDWDEVSTDT